MAFIRDGGRRRLYEKGLSLSLSKFVLYVAIYTVTVLPTDHLMCLCVSVCVCVWKYNSLFSLSLLPSFLPSLSLSGEGQRMEKGKRIIRKSAAATATATAAIYNDQIPAVCYVGLLLPYKSFLSSFLPSSFPFFLWSCCGHFDSTAERRWRFATLSLPHSL